MSDEIDRRATITQAIAAWEAKGPTSLTVALMAEALYDVRERLATLRPSLERIAWDTRPSDLDLNRVATAVEIHLTSVTPPGKPDQP